MDGERGEGKGDLEWTGRGEIKKGRRRGRESLLVILTHIHVKAPDGVIPVDCLPRKEHPKRSVILLVSVRPVSRALELPSLRKVCDHDYGGGAQLPNQSPEINHSRVQGTCAREEE